MEKVIEEFFEDGGRTSYPTLAMFVKKYLRPMEGNEKKALYVFKLYETKEASRRLEGELFSIKRYEASQVYLRNLVGERKGKQYQGYDKWAGLMLQWMPTIREM